MDGWKYKSTTLCKNFCEMCADLKNLQKPVSKSVRILRMQDKADMSLRELRRLHRVVPRESRSHSLPTLVSCLQQSDCTWLQDCSR